MATSGETSYQGGAGGKFRKKPTRIDCTPYARCSEPGKIRQISKMIVDPASRIISTSASKLFSLVFSKNRTTLPSISEANHESNDALPHVVPSNSCGDQERFGDEGDNMSNYTESGAVNDLEQILMQKTFTRAEVDRLTEILRSRGSDESSKGEKRGSETSTQPLAAALDRTERLPIQENEVKSQTLHGRVSAPLSSSSFLEEDFASPTELAKAYMGSRASKVTPLSSSLHNQPVREDVLFGSNVPYTPRSHSMSVIPRADVPYVSVRKRSENGYLTPVSRDRSVIFSMDRTPMPYARANHSAMLQDVGPMTEGKGAPSTSSLMSWKSNLFSGGKQASKRRTSDFDGDIGSAGPSRRIRRRTSGMSPTANTRLSVPRGPFPFPLTPIASKAAKGPIASIRKQFQVDGHKHNESVKRVMENGESSIASERFVCVPSQSSATARKILEQLDKFTPPKEKSYELKTTAVIDTLRSKPMLGMLHGQGPKCLDSAESLKLPQNVHENGVMDGLGDNRVIGARDMTSQKQARVDVNGPTKISILKDKSGPRANEAVTKWPTEDGTFSAKTTEAVVSCSIANESPKKQAVEQSADKESMKLEENKFSSWVGSNIASKEKHNRPLVESQGLVDGAVAVGESIFSVSKDKFTRSLMSKNIGDTGASYKFTASEKDIGLTFPATNATDVVTKPPASTSLNPSFNRVSSSNEPKSVQFSFASKSVDKTVGFTFSSGSVGGESSSLNVAHREAKPQTVNSTATHSCGGSHISSNGEMVKDDLFRHTKQTLSSTSASTTPDIFSLAVSSSSCLSNGSTASSSSLSLPLSDKSASNVLFANPSSTATTTSLTFPTATSTISGASIFQFGSSTSLSAAPSNSVTIPPPTSFRESELKPQCTLSFGGLNSFPFETKSAEISGSSSSSAFVFGGSASSSAAISSFNNLLQSSNTVTATSGSSPCIQASHGTVSSPFTWSMPTKYCSSASSQTFGLSASSPFNSGLSDFGSSASTVFASSLLGSNSQSITSSVSGSEFSATGFRFGSSSAASSTVGSAPITFNSSLGTTSGSIISFTAVATATATATTGPLFPSTSASHAANPVSLYGSTSPGNDQMNIENSRGEHIAQGSTPLIPSFGQSPSTPQTANFAFGAPSSSGVSIPFQFSSQQNPANTQDQSPFQVGSAGISAGGSFSVGTGAVEKSNRRIFKAKRDKKRR